MYMYMYIIQHATHRIPAEFNKMVWLLYIEGVEQRVPQQAREHFFHSTANSADGHVLGEDNAEGKDGEEQVGVNGEVEARLLAWRCQVHHGHLVVVKLETQNVVDLRIPHLLRHYTDLQLLAIDLPNLPQLSTHIAEKAVPFGGVVKEHSLGSFPSAEESWRLHLGVAKSQVLVQVVQSIQEVPEVASKNPEKPGIAVTSYVLCKVLTKHGHDLIFIFIELLCSCSNQVFHHAVCIDLSDSSSERIFVRIFVAFILYGYSRAIFTTRQLLRNMCMCRNRLWAMQALFFLHIRVMAHG